MRYLYSFLFLLLMPIVALRLLFRSIKASDYRKRWGERFGLFTLPKNFKNPIWLHAVSVGEVLASVPLIKALQRDYPDHSIIVTTMTPTGSARVKQIFKDSLFHIYLPYDLICIMRHFFNKVRPKIAIIMETEIWPNLLQECHRRHIPVLVGNARLSPQSMKYYRWIQPFIAQSLRKIDVIAPQSEQDARHFEELGAKKETIHMIGNIKFDMKPPKNIELEATALRNILGDERPIWIAGSTHEGEEPYILKTHQAILKKHPNALLILVPRHPERFNHIAELCKQYGFKIARRSANEVCQLDTQVYLGDTMGEMMTFYAASDVAYVGGSLIPTGGHNLLEPALFRLPILSGPHTFNFTDITRLLREKNGVLIINNEQELTEKIIELFNDEKLRNKLGENAYQVVLENRGALDKHLKIIENLL